MSTMGDTVERLMIPKRQDRVESACIQSRETESHHRHRHRRHRRQRHATPTEGVPPNPLPTWVTLPLDAKLPIFPGPKGSIVLYTTNLGEKIHKSSARMDFDLTDPYLILMSNVYKPLHDPHLKHHYNTSALWRRLRAGGLITHEGKVLCNLREYNEYRQYLRKINLALDRKRKQENAEKAPITSTKHMTRAREVRVKGIKTRVAEKYDEDKQRYPRLQAEEQKRKVSILRNWMKQDAQRKALAEARRKQKEKDRQKKLTESWELRKHTQEKKIDEDLSVQEKEQERKLKGIAKRNRQLQERQKKQRDQQMEMTETRQRERERMEQIYQRKLAEKIQKQRKESAKKHKKAVEDKVQRRSNWDLEKSILANLLVLDGDSVNNPLGQGRRDPSQGDTAFQDKEKNHQRPIGDLGDFKGASFTKDASGAGDKGVSESAGQDGHLDNDQYHSQDGVRFEKHVSNQRRTTAVELYEILRSQRLKARRPTPAPHLVHFGQRPFQVDDDLSSAEEETSDDDQSCEDDCNLDDIQKAAKAIVDMTVFLTTQVIYPAYLRYLKEDHPDLYSQQFEKPHSPISFDNAITVGGSKKSRSVRFSKINETITVAEYDYLERLRYLQHQPDFYDADDEEEKIRQSLEQNVQFALEDDTLEGKTEETHLKTKDSKDLSFAQGLAHPEMSVKDVTDLLKGLLQQLESGTISHQEVQNVAYIAKGLLGDIQAEDLPISGGASPAQSDLCMLQRNTSPALSVIVAGIVNQSEKDVQQIFMAQQMDYDVTSRTSPSAFSVMIVDKAVKLAIAEFDKFIESDTKPHPLSAPSPSADCCSSRTCQITRVKSKTSEFIDVILDRIVNEVRTEAAADLKDPSEISLLVRNIIQEAAEDVKKTQSLEVMNVSWDDPPVMKQSSESITGQYVRDLLCKTFREVELEQSAEQELFASARKSSVFAEGLVSDAIQLCLTELKAGALPKNDILDIASSILRQKQNSFEFTAEPSNPQHTVSLDEGLNKVCSKGTSSILIESFIRETLNSVKCDIEQGKISTSDVLCLATCAHVGPDFTPSAQARVEETGAVAEAERLVAEALNTGFVTSNFPNADANGGDCVQTDTDQSNTSLIAESYVKKVLQESSSLLEDSTASNCSLIAELAVKMAIEDAFIAGDAAPQQLVSAVSPFAEAIVKRSIENVLEDAPVTAAVLPQVIKDTSHLSNEVPGLPSIISHHSAEEHTHIDASHIDDDSSDEEVCVRPVIGHDPVHINHHIVEDTLSILSVKKDRDILQHNESLAARNSFADLMHPDVSSIQRFKNESDNEVCQKIMTLSKHCISLPAHIIQSVQRSDITSISAAGTLGLLTVEEDKGNVSVESREEEVVGVVTLHKAESLEEIHEASSKHDKLAENYVKSKKPSQKSAKTDSVEASMSRNNGSLTPKHTSSKITNPKPSTKLESKTSCASLKGRGFNSKLSLKQSILSLSSKVKSTTKSVTSLHSKSSQVNISTEKKVGSGASLPKKSSSLLSRQKSSCINNAKKQDSSEENGDDRDMNNNTQATERFGNSGCKTASDIGPTEQERSCEDVIANTTENVIELKPKESVEACALSNTGRESPAAETVDEEEENLLKKRSKRKSSLQGALSSGGRGSVVCVSSVPSLHHRSNQSLTHKKVVGLSPRLLQRSLKSHSSHQMVNLTPRPSSGYKNTPSLQNLSRHRVVSRGTSDNSLPQIANAGTQSTSGSLGTRKSQRSLIQPKSME